MNITLLRKKNKGKAKSFFEFPLKEQKQIIEAAAQEANREQSELVKKARVLPV